MIDHPYRHLPDHAFWRRSVAGQGPALDPVAGPFPALARTDRVATAGSCFAQHIARHLRQSGFDFLVTEPAHPIVPAEVAERHGYGLFSARFGNIYTSLQLLQLFDRGYGRFVPSEEVWAGGDGGLVDPFRPTVQPGGFASRSELEADRRHHLACVREMFETLDVFVFTLGLTETWVSAEDGACFPLCPGVAGGCFDPARHLFRNLRVGDVTAHLTSFLARLAEVNRAARVILTVSPVPLVATATGGHVLPATIQSKAVLRAAAQEIAEDHAHVTYFPSYEIITGPQTQGRYFASDLRSVTEEGVAHVMSVFLRHAAGIMGEPSAPAAPIEGDPFLAEMGKWVQAMCDETMLDDQP
jgi:hypothetical protein